jgi:hypothetical protein
MEEPLIEVIEDFFKDIEFTDDVIEFDVCSTIFDIKKFYETNLMMAKSNNKESLKKPYYDRILKLYHIYKKLNE